ncbi:olfactory receptor 52D1-like [Corythoichthys intestinalis]|uniref:olfactory receptor 52D1-like n=1 Tax=Corythoichthys intestinalis TaxID=161448 RepID=UPI0025A58686|nr:olfactory receptor 52D1-like [Corythoichthys intestinalis]XP_061811896.1 olfactory receptor 52D1-like [Nerophis lumbriciformis]
MSNATQFTFELAGLGERGPLRGAYFALALAGYSLTMVLNVTLVATVAAEKTLHRPVYVLVCNLCVSGVLGASCFYPKLLHDLLSRAHRASYAGCLVQIGALYWYVFCQLAGLTAMAYDRYVAICRPLSYRAVMTAPRTGLILLLTWLPPLAETAAGTALTARLPLCGRRLRRLFCTNWAVVKLSCADTAVNDAYGMALIVLHVAQAVLIGVSYGRLVRAALRSRLDRRRFARTCAPHLLTLGVFMGSLLFDTLFQRYGDGGGHLEALRHALAVEFMVVPPLLNPLVYGVHLRPVRRRVLAIFGPRCRANA